MPDTAIAVENLSKSFDKNKIFETCSISIETGTVFGLVGLNGSGKTTFIRMLLGLLKPDNGKISVIGFEPWRHDPLYYRKLGVILDHDGFTGNLTVAENLRVFAEAKGASPALLRAYLEECWKGTFLYDEFKGGKKKVKYLSRGQKMQCAICRAFLAQPRVFFLDEPTVALDVDAIEHFYSLVRGVRKAAATVLISSHQLSAIEDLCDSVGMLHNKTITFVKSSSDAFLPRSWMLRCGGEERFGAIITGICGSSAVYRNGAWHFNVAESENMIPLMIARLASEGCKIYEVREESETLKNRIQTSRSDERPGETHG